MDQQTIVTKKTEINKVKQNNDMPGTDLWTDGLICTFEFVRNRNLSRANSAVPTKTPLSKTSTFEQQTLNN